MSGTFLRNSPRRGRQLASSGTVFQRFVNSLRGTVIHPLVDMRVQDIGELTDHDTYWHLTYDRPVAAETPNVESDQFHLVLTHTDLVAIVTALRSSDHPELADRRDKVLRPLGRAR